MSNFEDYRYDNLSQVFDAVALADEKTKTFTGKCPECGSFYDLEILIFAHYGKYGVHSVLKRHYALHSLGYCKGSYRRPTELKDKPNV